MGTISNLISIIFLILIQWRSCSSAIILSMKNHHDNNNNHHYYNPRGPAFQANKTNCDLFEGTWVPDEEYPLYQASDCSFIDPQFNCKMFGRPDSGYLRYRWQPLNCELPRFNGVEFLMKMKGKSIMFVGDSLGRNQWESLICVISTSAPTTQTQMSRGEPLSVFKFLDYGVTLLYYKARYLVDIDVMQGKRVLKLEDISGNGNSWRNADVLIFNTGHWWTHTGSTQEWDLIEADGTYYKDMDRLVALEKALRTWAYWVDSNIDRTRTTLIFQAISPSHYNPNEWDGGSSSTSTSTSTKNCYGETSPMSRTANPEGAYSDQMRVANEVIRGMHNPPYLLDITFLSELRKDGHPSLYSGDLTPAQRSNPNDADCSHWCLPGVPDTWNQLLYSLLFS